MLVLTMRNDGEPVWIGNDIRIFVIQLSSSRVRIGIDAPKDVSVDRDVVRQRKLAYQPTPDKTQRGIPGGVPGLSGLE